MIEEIMKKYAYEVLTEEPLEIQWYDKVEPPILREKKRHPKVLDGCWPERGQIYLAFLGINETARMGISLYISRLLGYVYLYRALLRDKYENPERYDILVNHVSTKGWILQETIELKNEVVSSMTLKWFDMKRATAEGFDLETRARSGKRK